MFPEILIAVFVAALILEFFDASIGMGFGEITALLLLLGFAPLEAVPAVILASAILSLFAAILHHGYKNVDFDFEKENIKITLTFVAFGIIGILLAVLIAFNISELFLKAYIGLVILAVGIGVLSKSKRKIAFSWNKLFGLGSVAALNKGLTGGGYGPVISAGQILAGIKSKKSVGITSLSESIVSFTGFFAYAYFEGLANINWSLISALLIGGVISTPIAVYFVKKSHPEKLKKIIGLVSVVLGLTMLLSLFNI